MRFIPAIGRVHISLVLNFVELVLERTLTRHTPTITLFLKHYITCEQNAVW
jgi:hypothetical protein